MSGYELAQLNIVKATGPLASPTMTDFVGDLDRINSLTEQSPGFAWRLKEAFIAPGLIARKQFVVSDDTCPAN